jgi:hypothetical protein
MPRGDGTGPLGTGPVGRGLGGCTGQGGRLGRGRGGGQGRWQAAPGRGAGFIARCTAFFQGNNKPEKLGIDS